MTRSFGFYAYMAVLVCAVVILNVYAWPYDRSHPDNVIEVIYLAVGATVLNRASVRLARGQLSLAGLVIGATAILTNPLDATIVALGIAVGQPSRGIRPIIANAVLYPAIACLTATVAALLHSGEGLTLAARALVLVTYVAANLALVAVSFSLATGESIRGIIRANFSAPFLLSFGYMGLASLVVSYVLDGTTLGYLLATIVFVLALALTDTIAGSGCAESSSPSSQTLIAISSTAGRSRASCTTLGTTWPTPWATSARSTPGGSIPSIAKVSRPPPLQPTTRSRFFAVSRKARPLA